MKRLLLGLYVKGLYERLTCHVGRDFCVSFAMALHCQYSFFYTFMTLNINAYETQNVLFVVIISRMLFLL